MAAAVVALLLLVLLALTGGPDTGAYLVVAAPSPDRRTVVAAVHRAGGSVVSQGALPNLAVAWSDDPGFADAARDAGAWLVLPAPALEGCGSPVEGVGR